MDIIINEFKRIYSVKRINILMCILVASGMLYINEQKDNVSYREYSKIMNDENYSELDLGTIDTAGEQLLLERIEYAYEYNAKIENIIAQAEKNLQINIFSKKGSYTYNNQIKVQADFSGLRDLKIEPVNDSAVSTFFLYNYMVFFMLAAMFVIIEAVNVNEKKNLWTLVYATPGGRYKLGVARIVIIIFSAFLISAVFSVVILVIGFFIYGGSECLRAPIQSMPNFMQQKELVTIAEGIGIYGLYIACGLLIAGLFMWILLSMFRNLVISVLGAGIVVVIEFLLYYIPSQSVLAVFRYANIFSLILSKNWLKSYNNINIFNKAVGTEVIVNIFTTGMILICIIICIYLSGQRIIGNESVFTKIADRFEEWKNSLLSYMPLSFITLYEIIIRHKGILLFAISLFLIIDNSRINTAQYSILSKIKCEMYDDLDSLENKEIEIYFQKINDEYNELCEKAEKIKTQFLLGEVGIQEYDSAMRRVSTTQEKVVAAEEIQQQIEQLELLYIEKGIKGTLVNEEAFSHLLGIETDKRENFNLVCCYLFILLLTASFFAYDDEKKVRPIIISSKNGRTMYYVKKLIISSIIGTMLCLLEMFIFGKNVVNIYGFEHGTALIQSLSWLSDFPLKISIYTYIMIICVYRVIMINSFILIISSITVMYNRIKGILTGIIVLVPYLICQLGIKVMKTFSVINYIQCLAYQKGRTEILMALMVLTGILVLGILLTIKGMYSWKKVKV